MNKALTLSIIIPAYNEEHHIKDCLDSIARQTVMPNEVIVVDNNSTDASASIARLFPFVTVMHEKQQGMIFARNAGFEAAQSTLLGRIDADTVLQQDWVEKVHHFYNYQINSDTALSGSGYFKNVRFPEIHKWFIDGFFIMYGLLLGQKPLWGPNMIVPATVWEHIKHDTCAENPAIYEDMDITLHIKAAGFRTVHWRDLRVGTRQKHLESPRHMLKYILRMAGTFKHHKNRRWLPAYITGLGIFIFQYPFLYAFRTGENE